MYNYIGIDVSKKVLHAFNGKKYYQVKNEPQIPELDELITETGADLKKTIFIFEPTGAYSQNLKRYCASREIKVCIINPKQSSHFSKALGNRRKNDKVDAKMLYRLQYLISPEDISVPKIDKHVENLGTKITVYEIAMKRRIMMSNELEAAKAKDPDNKELLKLLKKELKRDEKFEDSIMNEIEDYVMKDKEMKQDYDNLMTIPGIGKKAAIYLLIFFRTYPDTNRSQITALAGLDVTERTSGTSVKSRTQISKSGNGRVRTVLYFPTMNAVRFNVKIKKQYDRLIENGKVKKVALIAGMRKLLLISHAIYKNKTQFCVDF